MSSHSPGPWKIWSDAWDIQVRGQADVRTADGRLVAAVSSRNDTNDRECEANARLIAAAPELLEMLRHMVHWLCDVANEAVDPAWHEDAAFLAAIKKAEHLIRRIEDET